MDTIFLKSYPQGVPVQIDQLPFESLVDLMHQSMHKYSSKIAFSNFGSTLTFKEVEKLSFQFAAFLQHELGLKKGERIALQCPNVLQVPVVICGALMAGLTIVNTNPLYTAREMKEQFQDSQPRAIVIMANFAHLLEEILPETKIEHVIITELGDLLGWPKRCLVNGSVKYIKRLVPKYNIPHAIKFSKALQAGVKYSLKPVSIGLDDLAFLQYTGGTTGVAKGAMLTHGNILSNVQQLTLWMKPLLKAGEEICLAPLPLYHIFSLTVNAFTFFAYGCHNILITNPQDIAGFVKIMKRNRFTMMVTINTLLKKLLEQPGFDSINFSGFKIAIAGGMALQNAVAKLWEQKTHCSLIEGYGLTETSPVVTCNPLDGSHQFGTIGLPLPSTEIRFVDNDGKKVLSGVPGELCVKGPQVMKGYWQNPEETRLMFDAEGWLKTGDIGVVTENGHIKLVDRKKDMILVSGFNVYPNEIEDVIAMHPKVKEVAVIGVADPKSSEAVKVFIVKRDPTLTKDEIMRFCKKNLTAYKRPKYIEFQTVLPKTNVGKILRRALDKSLS